MADERIDGFDDGSAFGGILGAPAAAAAAPAQPQPWGGILGQMFAPKPATPAVAQADAKNIDPDTALRAALAQLPKNSGSAVGPYALMGLGMGMMSSANPNEAWGAAMKGFMGGVQADTANALKGLEFQKHAQQQTALIQGLLARPDLSAADKWAIMSKPDVLGNLTQESLKPVQGKVSPNETYFNKDRFNPKNDFTVNGPGEVKVQKAVGPDGVAYDVAAQLPRAGSLQAGTAMPTTRPVQGGAPLPSELGPGATQWLQEANKQNADAYKNMPKATEAKESVNNSFERLKAVATSLRDNPDLKAATGGITIVPSAPGTRARDVEAQINILKSQVSLNAMQALKDMSATGSTGMGQLSNAEGKRLEEAVAALDPTQSTAAFRKQLNVLVQYLDDAKGRVNKAYDSTYGGGKQPKYESMPPTVAPSVAPEQSRPAPDRSQPAGTPNDALRDQAREVLRRRGVPGY